MEHLAKIIGYSVVGRDGVLGNLSDIYFCDKTWVVKHFVVDHGNFIDFFKKNKQSTLIPIPTVFGVNQQNRTFSVGLTKKELRSFPNQGKEATVSEQMKEGVSDAYNWFQSLSDTSLFRFATSKVLSKEIKEKVDTNLRSVGELVSYSVDISNGEEGKIVDFVVQHDEEPWKITEVVVRTKTLLSNEQRFLIKPGEIRSLEWFTKNMELEDRVS